MTSPLAKPADEEVNLESKEIIEDQLVSIISKDYLDVFSKCWCSRLFNSREFQLLLISFPFHRLASQLFPQCQLQWKMLALLLGLMWNSSHLSATVRKDYVLKRLIKVFKLSDSNWTTSWPATKSVNQGVSGGRNWKNLVGTIVTIRLEPGNSKRRIKGNGQCGITRWEIKTNCSSSFLLFYR